MRRSLVGNAVHVWLVELSCAAEELARCADLLSDDERAQAARFYFDRDRRRYVRARAALRRVLGDYLDAEPRELSFSYGPHGKPALAGRLTGALAFNVSHSEETALVAVAAGGRIGVDIEAVRPLDDRDELAASCFAADEAALLRRLPHTLRDTAFFTCWTRKEAYVKAVGDGLALPLDRFSVSFVPGQPPRLTVHDVDADTHKWVVHSLPEIEGYAAALVTDGPRSVTCRRDDGVRRPRTGEIEEMKAV